MGEYLRTDTVPAAKVKKKRADIQIYQPKALRNKLESGSNVLNSEMSDTITEIKEVSSNVENNDMKENFECGRKNSSTLEMNNLEETHPPKYLNSRRNRDKKSKSPINAYHNNRDKSHKRQGNKNAYKSKVSIPPESCNHTQKSIPKFSQIKTSPSFDSLSASVHIESTALKKG